MKQAYYSCGLILAAFSSACSDSDHDPLEDPAEHACEHASDPGVSISASETPEGAPELALVDTAYTVALVPGSAGYVKLHAPAEALLFANTANVVTGLSEDGTPIDLPAPAPNEFCPAQIPEHFDLDLDGSGPFVLQLGPVGVSEVWLMYVAAGAHGH